MDGTRKVASKVELALNKNLGTPQSRKSEMDPLGGQEQTEAVLGLGEGWAAWPSAWLLQLHAPEEQEPPWAWLGLEEALRPNLGEAPWGQVSGHILWPHSCVCSAMAQDSMWLLVLSWPRLWSPQHIKEPLSPSFPSLPLPPLFPTASIFF